jgi:glycerophosphoryl diester phosphodiesterase
VADEPSKPKLPQSSAPVNDHVTLTQRRSFEAERARSIAGSPARSPTAIPRALNFACVLFSRPERRRLASAGVNRREFVGALAGAALGRAVAGRIPPGPHRPVVVAHRGDHTRAPENSRSAIAAALRAGADYVELDVRRTRDGEHVLMHDPTVDRTTDGQGRVADLSWPDLAKLRLRGSGPAAAAETIPRLAEGLEALRDRAGLYLDFKDGDRQVVAQALRAAGMAAHTVIYDRLDSVAAWRQVAADLPLMVSPHAEDLRTLDAAALRERYPVEILDGPATAYTAEKVRQVRAAGFQVWLDIQGPWEEPAFWRRMVALDADGLQSDQPAGLVAFLRAEGRR